MRELFSYFQLQYCFWLLYRSQLTDEGNWILSRKTLRLIRKCFSCIPISAYDRFTRTSLQTISVEVYSRGFSSWLRKVETALPYINQSQDFPSDWVMGAKRQVSLLDYVTEDNRWYSQEQVVKLTLSYLEALTESLENTDTSNRDYCLLKIDKLLKDGAGYLLMLLLEYKETQWHQVTEKRVH